MIVINGKSYTGNSVSIKNNKITIDGSVIETEEKNIKIEIQGDIEELKVDECDSVKVTGSVKNLTTMSGDVTVKGDVSGNVKTMSGDVECGKVGGNISTMSGDITHQ
jgi:acetyl/propionyl-CoA carboxylase alpha subunit